MEERHHRFWHAAREHLTHWSVAGAILAVTGAAPERWFAELLGKAGLLEAGAPSWLEHIDYRLVAVAAGISVVVGDNLWRHHWRNAPMRPANQSIASETQIVSTTRPSSKLPDKPSIAVLAFNNMSGDPSQDYFSEGISDDIINQLSRSPRLFVIARSSSFTYRGQATDVKQIARELAVRYVLEGSVRRDVERIRISVQLVDVEIGSHIWAERYDRAIGTTFAVQDEITGAVARAIEPAISRAEQERLSRKPPKNLGAWEAYQLGLWHQGKQSAAENSRAREYFQQSIHLDPTFVTAYDQLAGTYIVDGIVYASLPLMEAIRLSRQQAEAALAVDPESAEAHHAMGWTLLISGDNATALTHFEQGLTSDPNNFRNRHQSATALLFGGRPAESRTIFSELLRRDPRGEATVPIRAHIAMSYYLDADYAGAVDAARRAIAIHPFHPWAYRWLAAALGQLDLVDEAREALQKTISLSPQSFRFYTSKRPPWMRSKDYEHLLDGLRRAGWRE